MTTLNETLLSGQTLIPEVKNDYLKIYESPLSKQFIPEIIGKKEVNFYVQKNIADEEPEYATFGSYCKIENIQSEKMLSDEQLSDEFIRIKETLLSNRILIDSLTNISERELYRFITEEFLQIEMNGNLYDFEHRYIYEEFYPNDEYRIKQRSSHFIRCFFGLYLWGHSIKEWKESINNYNELKAFQRKYHEFNDLKISFVSHSIDDEKAELYFNISFTATHHDQIVLTRFNGMGKALFIRRGTNFSLIHVILPGMEL